MDGDRLIPTGEWGARRAEIKARLAGADVITLNREIAAYLDFDALTPEEEEALDTLADAGHLREFIPAADTTASTVAWLRAAGRTDEQIREELLGQAHDWAPATRYRLASEGRPVNTPERYRQAITLLRAVVNQALAR